MKASVVDLRYKMKDVLKALDRREKVTLVYHGKVKGTIVPSTKDRMTSVVEHPFYNMIGDEVVTVEQQMDILRGSRFDGI